MHLIQIDPAQVTVSDRLRAIDADYVSLLAASIEARGLDTPIRVTEPDEKGFCRLIAGAHRHAAALQLGLRSIPAIPFSGNELQAELLEIEENLIRRELSPLDQATFLARHKTVWEALYPAVKNGGDRRRKSDRQVGELNAAHPLAERFSKVVAKKLGLAERSVQRAVGRYQALSPAIRERIAGTWIADNGAALDDLIGRGKRLTEAQQAAVLDLVLHPESGIRRIADALVKLKLVPPKAATEAGLAGLQKAWMTNRGGTVRARFLDWLLREGQGAKPVLEALERLQADAVNQLTEAELLAAGLQEARP